MTRDVSPSVSTWRKKLAQGLARMLGIQCPTAQNPLKMACNNQYLPSTDSNHLPDSHHQIHTSAAKIQWGKADDSHCDRGAHVGRYWGAFVGLPAKANSRQLSSRTDAYWFLLELCHGRTPQQCWSLFWRVIQGFDVVGFCFLVRIGQLASGDDVDTRRLCLSFGLGRIEKVGCREGEMRGGDARWG